MENNMNNTGRLVNRFNETIAECDDGLTSISQCADLILMLK
jgi:hypothetical protein